MYPNYDGQGDRVFVASLVIRVLCGSAGSLGQNKCVRFWRFGKTFSRFSHETIDFGPVGMCGKHEIVRRVTLDKRYRRYTTVTYPLTLNRATRTAFETSRVTVFGRGGLSV